MTAKLIYFATRSLDGYVEDRAGLVDEIVRHQKLAAIGWSQTAERLVAYLERRTPWDS